MPIVHKPIKIPRKFIVIYSNTDINSLIQLLPYDITAAIISKQMLKSVKKNEFLLKEGEVCHHLFKIESGICRTFRRYTKQKSRAAFLSRVILIPPRPVLFLKNQVQKTFRLFQIRLLISLNWKTFASFGKIILLSMNLCSLLWRITPLRSKNGFLSSERSRLPNVIKN